MVQLHILVLVMLSVTLVNVLTCVTTNERMRSSSTGGSLKDICGTESMLLRAYKSRTLFLFFFSFVLFNRQPSLHKMSMMSHRVRLMPYSSTHGGFCDPLLSPNLSLSLPVEPFCVSSFAL